MIWFQPGAELSVVVKLVRGVVVSLTEVRREQVVTSCSLVKVRSGQVVTITNCYNPAHPSGRNNVSKS
jgi:hypothetical protein